MEDDEPKNLMPRHETAKKLREIADAIEYGLNFTVQINGHRVRVPKGVRFEIDLETKPSRHEFEIEMRWDRRKGQ